MGKVSSTRGFPVPPKGKEIQTALVNGTLYYHRLGTAQAADAKIYARPDQPTWIVGGGLDESRRYLFVVTSKGTDKNELYIADLGDPLKPNLQAAIKPVVTGHDANYRALGVVNGRLYLQVDKDAPNRKIVSAPVETPGPKYWHDVIPEGKTAIQSADLVAGRLGVLTLEDVAATIRLYSLDGRDARAIPLPGLGTASGVAGRFDRPEVFYDYQSMLTPYEVLQFDPASGSSRPFEPPHLTFDPTQFEMERVFYNSKDGTRVPMFIAHRKGMVRDGSNPTMLYAYGGFRRPDRSGLLAGAHRLVGDGRRVRAAEYPRWQRVRRGLASRRDVREKAECVRRLHRGRRVPDSREDHVS